MPMTGSFIQPHMTMRGVEILLRMASPLLPERPLIIFNLSNDCSRLIHPSRTPDIRPLEDDSDTFIELQEYNPYPDRNLPDHWQYYVHPNGLPYFANKTLRVVTYANIKDAEVLDEVERYTNFIVTRAHTEYSGSFNWPNDWEIIIELEGKSSSDRVSSHVLVDHTNRRTVVLRREGPKCTHLLSLYSSARSTLSPIRQSTTGSMFIGNRFARLRCIIVFL